jgi:hypothetical protein
MRPFLSFYNNTFYKNFICPQVITYKICPGGCGGFAILKDIISGPFNYVEQNGYLKILIECVLGNGGRERGASYPPITFGH